MPQVIPLIALGVSAVATGYQVYQSREARSDAKDQAAAQRRTAQKAEKDLEERKVVEDLGRRAAEERRRMRALAAGAGGYRSQVLTGPGGAPVPQANPGLKEALGA